jgi:DamX protein
MQGADWVRAQPGDHYTLQLMAIKQEDTARQFIARRHLEGQAAYIRVERDGEAFYAVFYGSYPSRAEAQRAAKALPPGWDMPTPWVRRFKAVQSQLQK